MNTSQNIFLTGFMGSGKSSTAACLHEEYGFAVIEMDQQIEENEGMTISEIFARKGEEYFRTLETDFLRSLKSRAGVVVSCGGGVPLRECNVEAMKESGTVVYLTAKPETIFERVKNDTGRPLLEGHKDVGYIASMLEGRRPRYEAAADLCIVTDGLTPGEVARDIVCRLKSSGN